MPRQIEFTNNFGSQQRYNIRADGKLETGKHFFRNRSTAEHMPALQHEDLFAGAREIRGIHKTVMPASNNDDVVLVIHLRFETATDNTDQAKRVALSCRKRVSILIIARPDKHALC